MSHIPTPKNIHMYANMYACRHAQKNTCMDACMYLCMHSYTYMLVHAHTHAKKIYMQSGRHAHMHTHTHTHTHVHAHACTHTHTMILDVAVNCHVCKCTMLENYLAECFHFKNNNLFSVLKFSCSIPQLYTSLGHWDLQLCIDKCMP